MKTLSLRFSRYAPYLMPVTAAAATLAAFSAAQAQSSTWTNPATGGLWSNPANWAGGIQADGSGSTANFSTLELTADNTVALDSPRTLTGLTFGDSDPLTPANWILTDGGNPANVLTLDTTPTITVSALGTGATATVSAAIAGAGGLTKAGTGQLNLSGNNPYTGTTNANDGVLSLNAGGTITAGGINTARTAGARMMVNGGTLISGALSTFNNVGLGFLLSSGSAAFNGGLRSDNRDGAVIRVDGGTFTATTLELRRTQIYNNMLTATDASANGFYVTGGTATLTTLNIGTDNSSASARIDGGAVTVTGNINVSGQTGGARFCILQVKGGTLTSTDPTNGIVLGTRDTVGNNAQLYLTGGVATAEKVTMGSTPLVTSGSGHLYLNGGTLYLGSGGVERRAGSNNYISRIHLIAGTLAAKADWATGVELTTGTVSTNNAVIKAADAMDAPFNITLSGVISGLSGFTKSGAGTLILTGNNTYDGTGGTGTVISAGTLQVGAGGTTGTLGTGPVTNQASLVINRSDALTVANPISGTGTLTKTGAGTLTLEADNVLAGTTVSGGTLSLANPTGSATGAGPVAVQTGSTLGGTGTAAGTVTVASGGRIAPGTGVGTLTTGSLTLAAGSELHFEFNGSPANDRIAVPGTLTLNGGAVRLRQENSVNPWSSLAKYYLIKYGTLAGTGPAALTVSNPVSGVNYSFGTETVGADNFITLTLTGAGTPNTWNVDASGAWDDGANWTTGTPGGTGNAVNFLGAIASARTVTLNTPRTAGTLNFDNGNSYTLAGAALTFDNGASPAAANSLNGFHRINTAVALPAAGLNTNAGLADATIEIGGIVSGAGAVRHQGPGVLRLTGANTYSGGTSLANQGTVAFSTAGSLGTGAVTWLGDGTLRSLASLTLPLDASLATGVSAAMDTGGNSLTVSGIISGAGTLVKSGGGVLTLSASNSHSGGTRFMEGAVSFTALTNLGTGGLSFDGGTLLWGPGNTTDISARTVSLLAGGGTFDTGSNDVTLSSPIGNSGPGHLTKTGSGTLTFPAGTVNTWTGRTRILGGTLAAAAPDNLGPAPAVFVNNQLSLDGGIFQPTASLDLPATSGLTVGPAIGTINVPADVALGIPGGISDQDANPGLLNLTGTGTVTLTKNSTWTGGGTLQALTVNANAGNALGSGMITLEGTTLNPGANVTLPNAFTVNGSAVINLSNASPGSTLTGPLQGSGTLTVNAPGTRSQVSGDWTAFAGNLVFGGNGEWRISGFNDGFTNAKVHLDGTTNLVLSVNPNVGVPRIIRIGQLTGTGLLGGQPVVGRSVNWVVGGLNTNSTFDGTIKDNMSQNIGVGNAASQFTKAGTGILTLTGNSTYTDITTVADGTLLINGDHSAATGAVTVTGGTLGGSGTIGGTITVQAPGTLSPGTSVGTLTTNAVVLEGTLLTEYSNTDPSLIDKLKVNGNLTLGAGSALVLQSLGAFPVGSAHIIATYSGLLDGTFGNVTGLPPGYRLDYAFNDGNGSNNIAIVAGFSSPAYTAWAGANSLTGPDAEAGADPDKDGRINLLEFALDGNPNSGLDSGKSRTAITPIGGDQALTLTIPVRIGADFTGATSKTAAVDGIRYTIEGSDDLTSWSAMIITEVLPAASAGLPPLNSGWSYRTFRTPDTVSADPRDSLRVRVAPGS